MKNKKELISVFTVNWNGRKWLKRCLTSLKRQTYTNIEIIVVDNASSDDSVKYIRKNFPTVKIVFNDKNLGLAQAINIGVKNSLGKYILFVNNDTWVKSDFIETLHDFYTNHDYAVISAAEKRYHTDINFICNTTIDPTGSPAYYIPTYSRNDKLFYLTVCFFCSKNIYNKTHGVDSDFFMYFEDVDWFWRLTLLGKKFAVVKDCFIYHEGAGSSGTGIKYTTFLWRNQNTLQSLLKNYSALFLSIILPFYFLQNFIEIFFFLIILKPRIAYSYIKGWVFNVKHIPNTFKKRRWIQKNRKVSDFEIIKKMYFGSGKLLLLKNYLGGTSL